MPSASDGDRGASVGSSGTNHPFVQISRSATTMKKGNVTT
jgi:hypothetical protein